MIGTARAVEPDPAPVARIGGALIEHLSVLLLVAVGLDLVLTRVVARLAIFVPKEEPFAAGAGVLGRVGAATDALVPIVGVALLVTLLFRAGRTGTRLEQGMLVAIALIASGGLALLVLPPAPGLSAGLWALTGWAAALAGLRLILDRRLPVGARAGFGLVATSMAIPSAWRAFDATGLPVPEPPPGLGLLFGQSGQIAFVTGGAAVGLAGVLWGTQTGGVRRPMLAAGVVAGAVVLAAGTAAPAMSSALWIWSLGLSGSVPVPALAIATGLLVAGMPLLYAEMRTASIGAGIILLAGHGLAASGLVLAGLLGLFVAAFTAIESSPSPGPSDVRVRAAPTWKATHDAPRRIGMS